MKNYVKNNFFRNLEGCSQIGTTATCEWKMVKQGFQCKEFYCNLCCLDWFYYIVIHISHIFQPRILSKFEEGNILFSEYLRKTLRPRNTVPCFHYKQPHINREWSSSAFCHFKTLGSLIARHSDWFWASRTQLLPAILRMSTLHLAWMPPTLRLPRCSHSSRIVFTPTVVSSRVNTGSPLPLQLAGRLGQWP